MLECQTTFTTCMKSSMMTRTVERQSIGTSTFQTIFIKSMDLAMMES